MSNRDLDRRVAEAWKPIPGLGGWYEASDQGRIRSVERVVRRAGRPYRVRGRIIRTAPNTHGYLAFQARGPEGVRHLTVHVAVLRAFLGNAPPGGEARHLDGDQRNNRLDNLRWGTARDNAKDRIRHGTAKSRAKLCDADVVAIRQSTEPGVVLAERYGVSEGTISNIRCGRTWRRLVVAVAEREAKP